MTISSSSSASNRTSVSSSPPPPSEAPGNTSSSASTSVEIAPLSDVDALSPTTSMRTFAVIICTSCLYLEFPGCDVHGVLYTERLTTSVSAEDGDGANDRRSSVPTLNTHAKCPKCTAATNNVRPFRDGCRRCKASTVVSMWNSSVQEISQAHDAFPRHVDELEHTALVCERCQSVIFPRARETLTRRTPHEPLTATHGKALQVSNFQLSMPHVDGCSRKGMPLLSVAIQLPKSELEFLLDRVEQCPLSQRIQGGPQYRKRHVYPITQQNNLHQVYLQLLSVIVKTFDSKSPSAVEPLKKILTLFEKMEPLALFSDWSPPRQLSKVHLSIARVTASSELDKQHGAHRVIEPGSAYWRSAIPPNSKPHEEWITFQFASAVTLSCLMLRWHSDHVPSRFSVGISTDGNSYETVALVVDRAVENRIVIAKGKAIISIKLTLFTTISTSCTYGLESITCIESIFESVHTSSEIVLQDLQQWLQDASMSSSPEVRDLALQALQKLSLASGSLCGLLQLAIGLILNVPSNGKEDFVVDFDEHDWNQQDMLSSNAKKASLEFLKECSRVIRQVITDKDKSYSRENSTMDTGIFQQMTKMLQTDYNHHPTSPRANGLNKELQAHDRDDSDVNLNKDKHNSNSLDMLASTWMCQPSVLQCITRRSQLGMVVLYMLSELSTWQMVRMQKVEEFAGKREEEIMQLEEPYSLEIRPQLFHLSNCLLTRILSPWLSGARAIHHEQIGSPGYAENGKSSETCSTAIRQPTNAHHSSLYDMLKCSFEELGSAVDAFESNETSKLDAQPRGLAADFFSPDVMCVALLQIVISNIRRLVLSRIDPVDIGIEPASCQNGDDTLSAPPALEPLVSSLEQLIALGTKRSDKFFPVSLKAAAAVEVGMEAFYPSAHQRTQLLTSRMGAGAILEVQVRWPVQERDQEDPRYERLILMLQFECIRMGIKHAIRGNWFFFMHLVIEVPASQDTQQFLTQNFAPCIQRAGFSSWQVASGAQEISINLQRHLHWDRAEKMSHDSGAGWIRVYPRDVAAYDDVLDEVDHFLSKHGKRDASKTLP